ncbi:hypothetical protein ES705_14646 [subsurface metagenome]
MEYWKKLNPDGTISTVESHSYSHKVPGGKRITKKEYDAFIASLPVSEPEPVRDPLAEIDEIKARVEKLERTEAREGD